MTALRQLLTELRRRGVIRVVLLYAIAGWIIVQVAATVLPELHVPQWSVTLVIVLVALGLPLAAILAWAFDVGESGVKRTTAPEAGTGTAAAQVPVVSAGGPTALPVAAPSEQPIVAPMPSTTASSDRMDRDRRSIAVLPFANLTGNVEKDYLGDGLAEELIHTLARVPGLRVPARTSSFAYKGRNVDVRHIARELEVEAVLEGSVRSAGEHIRVTAQLSSGTHGYHLWSQNYDRQFADLFALQDDLATAIVQAVGDHLHIDLPSTVQRIAPTQDLQAYDLYLQARSLIDRLSAKNLKTAGELLQTAIERDP